VIEYVGSLDEEISAHMSRSSLALIIMTWELLFWSSDGNISIDQYLLAGVLS
jgi:hypothetical protein